MSEIKGQILGIILVLSIFGAVGAALKGVFDSMKDNVVQSVEDITSGKTSPISSTNMLHF